MSKNHRRPSDPVRESFDTPKTGRGVIKSRLDHPVTVSYDGLAMIIPARSRSLEVEDANRLGSLPTGVVCVRKN